MNIAMTGATGYISKHLSNYLTEKGGHRIIPLGRSMFREGMSGYLIQTLTHCDVVINLAGAPINKRWTLSRTYKARYHTLWRSAFSGRGSDAADASPFASYQDSHRHRSRYTGFSVDIDTGSLPCNGVLYHSRRDTWGI